MAAYRALAQCTNPEWAASVLPRETVRSIDALLNMRVAALFWGCAGTYCRTTECYVSHRFWWCHNLFVWKPPQDGSNAQR